MEEMLHIPISATYEIDHETGQVTRTAAEYADVSADFIARFLIQRFGLTPWKKEDSNE
ncbi:hypothetical protein [Phascolarctobacterium faecium]|uniref:hypothetical protein n=1 Tax=Phascolarctobacterium faecium TaxID=33025 RepID=UPI003AB28CF6